MHKQAINLLKNFDQHILITGATGTGKSTLLAELRIDNSDAKYYHFPEITSGKPHCELCDENFDDFDFLVTPEQTLILDAVRIGANLEESKVVRFIKIARKHGKRLIVVTYPSEGERIKPLFGAVISLTGRADQERTCEVEVI
ncbi:ATP-binding protein [Enterobacter asburiae]|uniref:ATP-binding protein n=1 Tax=Enterobacter asburiae TaxID=61645 RepID=UPI003F56DB4D